MADAKRWATRGTLALLGPAFVASLSYVDPGNVAANISAGNRYGYSLIWVLLAASLMSVLLQYSSAKLGIVTGRSLPQLVTDGLSRRRWLGLAYGLQGLVMAIATDFAEVVGGALALFLLFGIPLWLGGLIVGLVSMVLLRLLLHRGERVFERGVASVLAIVVVGFLAALFVHPPDAAAALAGAIPSVPSREAIPLIAAMLGATVMPHAIYLHSSLAIDRYRPGGVPVAKIRDLLHLQKLDVGLALAIAGAVNVAMLLIGATVLHGAAGDTIEAAYAGLAADGSAFTAVMMAVGLLASGIGSAVVGTHAGSRMIRDTLPAALSPTTRRFVTLAPALILLVIGVHPTALLVLSQLVLSFGIALAAVPLVMFTGNKTLMGEHVDPPWFRVVLWAVVAAVVTLNVAVLATSL
ncbi:MAG: Nramp family divalent metal transporter [Micropruina sp.]|nr:Nramp family divalent metal transporter [Micropruina sp.]